VRKQGQRALEKIAHSLRRRGVAVALPAIATGLGAALCQPAHAAAVPAISSSAAGVAAGVQSTYTGYFLTLMNTKTKSAVITAAWMAVPLLWQSQRVANLEEKLDAAQQESARRAREQGHAWPKL
jgi:hypothetical protein